jgi:hypothetical protein
LKEIKEIKITISPLQGNQAHPLHATWSQGARPNIVAQCLINNNGIGQQLLKGLDEDEEIEDFTDSKQN